MWNVTIRTPATRANADGIDIDSVSNVTVANSSVEAGDDGIAVKTNASAASNITVKNSKFYGTHGISIGSQTFDGVTNVLFTGNYVYGNDLSGNAWTNVNAINIKTDPDCGGNVKQVTYTNTCIAEAKHLIVMNTRVRLLLRHLGHARFHGHRRQRSQISGLPLQRLLAL